MPTTVASVKIEGLRELQRDLKQMESRLDKELRKEMRSIAKLVADDARDRVPVVTGRAQKSLVAGASSTSAYVKGGKETVPYFGWLDFGSRTPASGGTSQTIAGRRAAVRRSSGRRVGPWAGSGKGPDGGRFIYPAVAHHRTTIVKRTTAAVNSAKKKAGLR